MDWMGGFSKGWKIEKIGSPQRAVVNGAAQGKTGDQYCTMILASHIDLDQTFPSEIFWTCVFG